MGRFLPVPRSLAGGGLAFKVMDKFKVNWGPDRLPQRSPRDTFCAGAPPPSIAANVPTKWCTRTGDRVVLLPPPMRTGSRGGNTWAGHKSQGSGFWGPMNAYTHPPRSHQGRRGVMIEAQVQRGTGFAGYKRAVTPQPKVFGRDHNKELTRSHTSMMLDYVIVKDAINGRPRMNVGMGEFDEGRCGPSCPPGYLSQNLKEMAERTKAGGRDSNFGNQDRPMTHFRSTAHGAGIDSSWTTAAIRFMTPGGEKMMLESEMRLESLPLYSSFGLPQSPGTKQFDPSVFMPDKWKEKMRPRTDALTASKEAMHRAQVNAEVEDKKHYDDEFSPGIGGFTAKGSLRRDSIGGGYGEGIQIVASPDAKNKSKSRRGSTASRRGSTITVRKLNDSTLPFNENELNGDLAAITRMQSGLSDTLSLDPDPQDFDFTSNLSPGAAQSLEDVLNELN